MCHVNDNGNSGNNDIMRSGYELNKQAAVSSRTCVLLGFARFLVLQAIPGVRWGV